MKFNENLKITRENKGITTQQLALAINVKPYTITDWETGRSEPSITNLIKLSQFFNVSVDFLIGNKLDENSSYNEIIKIINDYQEQMNKDELLLLLDGLSDKNQTKLLNIMKTIKKELFNK